MAFTTKISIGPLATVTDYVVLRFYTAENPGVQVAVTTLAPPHSDSELVSQLLDDDVAHICKIYYSIDGIVLGTLKHEFEFQPTNQTIEVEEPLEIHVVDESPAAFEVLSGQNEYNDVSLVNKQYFIEQRGTGTLRNDEWDYIVTGGFKLLGDKLFDSGDTYFLHFIPIISQDSFPSTSQLIDVKIVSANETIDDTYYRKVCIAAFATTIGTTTFPSLATLPNTKIKFSTHGGSQRYWKIQFYTGENVSFLGVNKNIIYLAKGEELELIIKSGVAYVTGYSGAAKYVGQRIWGDKLELNTIFRDGTQYNQSDYPRLVEWISSLPVGQVVDYTTWNTSLVVDGKIIYPNKGKFAIDGTTTFKVPDDRNMSIRALRYIDSTVDSERQVQGPGGYQIDSLKDHDHFMFNHQDGGTPYASDSHSTGGNLGYAINGSNTEPDKFKTSSTGGIETRMENIGLLPLLII